MEVDTPNHNISNDQLAAWLSTACIQLTPDSQIHWEDVERRERSRLFVRVTCGQCRTDRYVSVHNIVSPSRYRERYAFTGLCKHCQHIYFPVPHDGSSRRGQGNGSWMASGYVRILVNRLSPEQQVLAIPMQDGNETVLEHRLVMALYIKRPLYDYETVHHINGNRQDNTLENLRLYTSRHGRGFDGYYQEYIEALTRIADLEQQLRQYQAT